MTTIPTAKETNNIRFFRGKLQALTRTGPSLSSGIIVGRANKDNSLGKKNPSQNQNSTAYFPLEPRPLLVFVDGRVHHGQRQMSKMKRQDHC